MNPYREGSDGSLQAPVVEILGVGTPHRTPVTFSYYTPQAKLCAGPVRSVNGEGQRSRNLTQILGRGRGPTVRLMCLGSTLTQTESRTVCHPRGGSHSEGRESRVTSGEGVEGENREFVGLGDQVCKTDFRRASD